MAFWESSTNNLAEAQSLPTEGGRTTQHINETKTLNGAVAVRTHPVGFSKAQIKRPRTRLISGGSKRAAQANLGMTNLKNAYDKPKKCITGNNNDRSRSQGEVFIREPTEAQPIKSQSLITKS
ncbi:hypothetical protein PIB30_048308 [Stylosanthes scabra]|uniref:Uncharacterized protein n=1 Tax=Stylosanthes scabra TaxID=79078 RepID=A0ABU6WH41_9FABA|nr:hypothetical protein [Stylosanthes scabra]